MEAVSTRLYDPGVRIDHVLLACRDIEATGVRLLRDYGLASVPGGTHPDWGTGNRIVPLGEQYLELIGITDHDRAATNPFGRWIAAQTRDGDALAGLMVEPDDFDAVCARLQLTPTPGQRALPDGTSLTWRLAGVAEAITRSLPCFISWGSPGKRLTDRVPEGGIDATGIAWVELGGEPEEIRAWLGGEASGLRLVGRKPGVRRMAITSADGELILDAHP